MNGSQVRALLTRITGPTRLLLLALAALAPLALPSSAAAQTPVAAASTTTTQLSGGQGPRSPFVGPSAPPPDGEGPPRDASTLPPGRSARCRWDLRGGWASSGRRTDPTADSYSGRLNV